MFLYGVTSDLVEHIDEVNFWLNLFLEIFPFYPH